MAKNDWLADRFEEHRTRLRAVDVCTAGARCPQVVHRAGANLLRCLVCDLCYECLAIELVLCAVGKRKENVLGGSRALNLYRAARKVQRELRPVARQNECEKGEQGPHGQDSGRGVRVPREHGAVSQET